MIEAHALTKRYGDTTAVDTGDHAGAGGVARSLTLGFGATIFGAGNLPTALLVGAAWAINLAVAERQIRKRPRRGTPRRRSRCHCHDRQDHAGRRGFPATSSGWRDTSTTTGTTGIPG